MRAYTPVLAGFAVLLASGPVAAQDLDARDPIARSYNAYTGLLYSRTFPVESDILVFYGRTLPRGPGGRWMIRMDVGGGFTLYGNTTDGGLLLGTSIGVVHVFTGDYLDLGGRLPVEFFASGGVAGYRAWHPAEAPEESAYIPAIAAGFGLRFVSDSGAREMVTLELLREERFGIWTPKLFMRLGINIPRGGPAEGTIPKAAPRAPLSPREPERP